MNNELTYHLIIGSLRILAHLPLWLLYRASDCMYVITRYLIRYRRQAVAENLARAFPEQGKPERLRTERKFYLHLCDCIVETIKLLHISDKEIDRRVQVEGGDMVERLAADGCPVVLFLGHYGNWEWVQAVTRHYARPATSGQVYKPLHDAVMERVMLKIRSRFNTISIPQKRTVRTLLRMTREGRQWLIGFIADQRPNSGNPHHWTTFLGQDTAYVTGGEEIGRHTKAHFLYLDVEKTRRGHYRMTFHAIDPIQDGEPWPYTRGFMHMLEQTIRREPAYWLWSHKRWKGGRPDASQTIQTTPNDKNI